jgi:hypothetical protein
VTIDGIWIGEWIYWPLFTPLGTTSNYSATANLHNSQITAAPAKLFPACYIFNSSSLATASNSGNSSASRAHVVTVWRISRKWTLADCHFNYSAISSQPSLQSSTQLPTLNWTLTRQPTTSLHSTQLNCTQVSLGFSLYSLGADPTGNTASSNPSIVMDGFLAIARILLTCLPAVTKQRMFPLAIVA